MLRNERRKQPCGYRGDPKRNCQCNPLLIDRYLAKISGPLLDRIDIHVEVPAVPFREISDSQPGTSSATMVEQVRVAREIQNHRFSNLPGMCNGKMSTRQIRQFCKLGPEAETLIRQAMEEMGFSARAHDKILRVARTIADLDRSEVIQQQHLHEAINYRTLDRTYWA